LLGLAGLVVQAVDVVPRLAHNVALPLRWLLGSHARGSRGRADGPCGQVGEGTEGPKRPHGAPACVPKPVPKPRRAAKPPVARRRKGERGKAPVKAARSSYKPKTKGPTSTESDRLKAIHAELDAYIRALFPDAQPIFDYGMHGWKVPRRRKVEWTKGTIDPNWLMVGVAERKNGISLHLWNPVESGILSRKRKELEAAGFKPMVGCLQYTRKGEYPVGEVKALLSECARQMDSEA
jgi:hypothetical protein